MGNFEKPQIAFHDQSIGRIVTVKLDNEAFPNVTVSFLDNSNPDETNGAERKRVLAVAKRLFEEAASKL